jgi:hypothetical protein
MVVTKCSFVLAIWTVNVNMFAIFYVK